MLQGRFVSKRLRNFLGNGVLVGVAVGVSLIAAELGFRTIDGYRLGQLQLVPVANSSTVLPATASLSDARHSMFNKEFDIAWFATDPPNYDRSPHFSPPADWDQAIKNYKKAPGERAFVESELKFLYNDKWLEDACRTGNKETRILRYFKRYPGFVYSFRSPDGSINPPYRIVPRGWDSLSTYYNNFGFRGPDIVPRKPDRVIRLAFLGASTTANGWPFTYPEYVVHFLRQWARADKLDVEFDLINAGRGGTNAPIITNILRYEVMPLRPDIVVYYEGANDLHVKPIVQRLDGKQEDRSRPNAFMELHYLPLEQYSALLVRTYALLFRRGGPAAEPPKPPHRLTFDLKQTDPDLTRMDLPFNLPEQIADLRRMAKVTQAGKAIFFMTSFITLVEDGMQLDPERDRLILSALNNEYAPLTYAETRSAVDFQNAVFRKLAKTEHWPFLEVDRYFPQDPTYFGDMVHFKTSNGFRLHGWIVAQLLAPYIKNAIAAGRLPRAGIEPNPEATRWATEPPTKFDLSCYPD